MPRLAAALALVAMTSAAGCSRNHILATGAVMAGTGIVMVAAPNTTTTHTGFVNSHDTWEEENHDYDIAGGILTVLGTAVLLAGAVARDDRDRRDVRTTYTPTYAPVYPPTTVIHAPNAQTVIVTDTVVEPTTPSWLGSAAMW